MRRVPIEFVRPGMTNATSIYSADGRNLLSKGIVLSDFYIEKLKAMGVHSLYVHDGIADDIIPPEVISEKTRVEMVRTVHNVFSNLSSDKRINTKAIQGVINSILNEVFASPDVLVHLTDIRAYDDYTFNHSINVCIISLMVGVTLKLSEAQLRDLGVGALLHDVGKIKISKEVFDKPGKLSPEEYEEIKKHTVYGFEILRRFFEISLMSAHVAFQHHERCDGSGYPRGLPGKEIQEISRIVAAVDVYDALLADRSYRMAVSPRQAVDEIKKMSETQLDREVVEALIRNIAIYPVGSIVQLSSGEIGVVLKAYKRAPERPLVRRLLDCSGAVLPKGQEINLGDFPDLHITKVFEDEETYSAVRKLFKKE